MLRSLKKLEGYIVLTPEGEIGKTNDFYFDSENWKIRYFIVDMGGIISGKKVLISPAALKESPDWETGSFALNCTKEQVEKSPGIENKVPLTRQKEMETIRYYNWPVYWTMAPSGMPVVPGTMPQKEGEQPEEANVDYRLISADDVFNYSILAVDEEIGKVADIIADDETWEVRYLAVKTGAWLPGKTVLIDPKWIEEFDWREKRVGASLTSEEIKNSPEYEPSRPVNRKYEERLYDYYGRPRYWEKQPGRKSF